MNRWYEVVFNHVMELEAPKTVKVLASTREEAIGKASNEVNVNVWHFTTVKG